MNKLLYKCLAKLSGKNCNATPKEVIIDQMNEPRSLPMGVKEFHEWSDRIIGGALVPSDEGLIVGQLPRATSFPESKAKYEKLKIFEESQKFALANALMHLGPTESHKPDAFFIHSLRKFAVNQVADTIRKELHAAAKARTAAEEEAAKKATDEATKT